LTTRLSICLACCATILSPAENRLYVEPFITKTGAEKLRDDVITELRKQNSIPLASSESGADLILGGGGEIWVKGYRSLNPRSGRLPSAGTPVYGGYLSVELRDSRGVTLWSYLATPGADSEDIAKDLSRRIAKHLDEALLRGVTVQPVAPASPPGAALRGAGATFPYPVYEKWFTNYRRVNPNLEIAYEAVGSEGGIRRLLAGQVDFGASDSPLAVRELAPAEESRYLFLPAVVGAVVPIVNLPGVSGQISFTPEALAGIFLGKIVKWNDPALREANRGLRLPDLPIVVVHRSDGSGTSYAFTDFLSKTVPEWKDRVGAGLVPKWPAGRAATGNDGVAKLVKELGGSIGYVEFIYALRNQLSYGKVRNSNGEFLEASLESIEVAANESMHMGDDLKVSIVNAPGAGAYPISSFTWFVTPAHIADDAKRAALAGFLTWMLGPGQAQAAALGYLALPKDVVARGQSAIRQLR
jgi:phosphate transport system substrate-binding protein